MTDTPIVTRLRDMIAPNTSGYYIAPDRPLGEMTADISEAADLITELVDALWECADDLEAEIEAKRGSVLERTTERDLASVRKARAALAKAGGQ